MKSSLALTVLGSALLLVAAAPAAAEERICTGTIGAVYLDNIFVPDGRSCVLDGTRAKGNIVVGSGASLSARSVTINGNLQAEEAEAVSVYGRSSFGGSVQLVKGVSASIEGARIEKATTCSTGEHPRAHRQRQPRGEQGGPVPAPVTAQAPA